MNTRLQNLIRLNELAESIHRQGKRIAVLLEGRDGAGKSGTIRDFTHYLPPYTYKVVPSFMPTKKQMAQWLPSWSKLMPRKGEIVFYDRSHYSRALLQPIMNWCSQKPRYNFY
jgi:polyphosphate kinase 2 (PPK2 family)